MPASALVRGTGSEAVFVVEDGSATREGELGYFTPGALPPAVEKAAFALRVGAVSGGKNVLIRCSQVPIDGYGAGRTKG